MLRYYEILRLRPGASPLEIQQAYRDLVRVWHPDRFAHDPRLQKIAEQRLKEMNTAYIALEKLHRETPPDEKITFDRRVHAWPWTSPRSWAVAQPGAAAALWFAVLPIAISATAVGPCAFWTAPLRALASIGEDARADPFYGWNGIVPKSMDRFVRFHEATAPPDRRDVKVSRTSPKVARRSDPSAGFREGIGEIQVHNRTGEDTVVPLTIKRARGFTLRKATLAPQGDATLGGLGADLYIVDLTFPNGRRPQMRLGPFVMVQTETAAEKTADRYEVTLKPK